jgi:hypothetical protein
MQTAIGGIGFRSFSSRFAAPAKPGLGDSEKVRLLPEYTVPII